jgi:hypothetical protein
MYGKMSGRKDRADYLGQYPCPDCRSTQGEERGCKPLLGTDKQRAWAGDLRASYLAAHPELTAEQCGNLSQASAWWIDNRNSL